MTAKEAQKAAGQLTAAFGVKTKVEKTSEKHIWLVRLPFYDRKGEQFRAYLYRYTGDRDIVISDGGGVIEELRQLGTPQLRAIQQLLGSFGVKLRENLTV